MDNVDVDAAMSTEDFQKQKSIFDPSNFLDENTQNKRASDKQLDFLKTLAEQTKTFLPLDFDLVKMPMRLASKAIEFLQYKRTQYKDVLDAGLPPTKKQINTLKKFSKEELFDLGVYDLETISKKDATKAISKYIEEKEQKKRFSGASTWGMPTENTPKDQLSWTL